MRFPGKFPILRGIEWAVDNAFGRIAKMVAFISTKTAVHYALSQQIVQSACQFK